MTWRQAKRMFGHGVPSSPLVIPMATHERFNNFQRSSWVFALAICTGDNAKETLNEEPTTIGRLLVQVCN